MSKRDKMLKMRGPPDPEEAAAKRDLAKVQAQFSGWAQETGLPYVHLSRICALSIGENYTPHELASRAGGEE
jgi:hypothetical protein